MRRTKLLEMKLGLTRNVAAGLFTALFLISTLGTCAEGRIIVVADDWVLGSSGFSSSKSTGQFATNVLKWLSKASPSRFTGSGAFSSTPPFFSQQNFLQVITDTSNVWIQNDSISSTSLSILLSFDAVFLGDSLVDSSLLTQYVHSGGNVYLYTIGAGDGLKWNPFLENFGLGFGSALNGSGVIAITNRTHPLFSGPVTNLYFLVRRSPSHGSAHPIQPTAFGPALISVRPAPGKWCQQIQRTMAVNGRSQSPISQVQRYSSIAFLPRKRTKRALSFYPALVQKRR